jgi:hypothetical protein
MCIYYASHEGMTLTREGEHLGRWSRQKRNIAPRINNKIASDLKYHSSYRNISMATERREMNGC